MDKNNLPYLNYWKRKKIQEKSIRVPVIDYWLDAQHSPVEQLYARVVSDAESVLDYGAGDLKIKRILETQGLTPQYYSCDIGDEFSYSYKQFTDIDRTFDVVFFLDVLEHLKLADGLELVLNLLSILKENGRLILQTPNGKCIRNHLGSDMTHLQLYNVKDLYSYFVALGYNVEAKRVRFRQKHEGFVNKVLSLLGAFITSRILGVDYADNILLVIEKSHESI